VSENDFQKTLKTNAKRATGIWSTLNVPQRRVLIASVVLTATFFLPWYHKQFFAELNGQIAQREVSLSAWGSFSFIEAAVLMVAIGTLILMLARGEGKSFHLPGGDGTAVLAAGVWGSLLIVIRMVFDKPGAVSGEQGTTVGIDWGIVVALFATLLIAYLGERLREQRSTPIEQSSKLPAQAPLQSSIPKQTTPNKPASSEPEQLTIDEFTKTD